LFSGEIPVQYGFIFLSNVDPTMPDLMETRRGQQNGLCGAAVTGVLSLITGLHTGRIWLDVEWLVAEPELHPHWEDAVEVSFTPDGPSLLLSTFDYHGGVQLPAAGDLRARYCALGMDEAHQQDVSSEVLPGERYLLQLWPGPPAPDAILRQTSEYAAYWHGAARALPPPPSPKERAAARQAEAERAREAAARHAERRESSLWAGRVPSARLRNLGGNVLWFARSDRYLLDLFEALDDGTQRAAARWLARRAFEVAGLDGLEWARPALAAMDAGDPLPEPFSDPSAVFPLVHPPGQIQATAHVVVGDQVSRPAMRVHSPSAAIPAIFSAVHPDPLRALVDTFTHTAMAFGDRREAMVAELRERWLDRS
jgi:hypothetical protein